MCSNENLGVEVYTDSYFQIDVDDRKSTSWFAFIIGKGTVCWKSCKQDTTADFTTEAEYIAACEAVKEAIWICEFIQECGVVPSIYYPIIVYYDNNRAITNAVEPRSHRRTKYIEHRFHLILDIIHGVDVAISKIASA